MIKKFSLKSLREKYRQNYSIPEKNMEQMAGRNIKYLKPAMIFLLVFGAAAWFYYFISDFVSPEKVFTKYEIVDRFLYLFYAVYAVFALVFMKYACREKEKYKNRMGLSYCTLVFLSSMSVLAGYFCEQAVNGFLIFSCVSTVALLMFYISPFGFAVIQTCAALLLTPVLCKNYGSALLINVWIFMILNIFLVFSRYKRIIRDIRNSDELIEQNDHLSSELVSRKNQQIKDLTHMVRGMASVIESRDDDTGHHIQRTSEYVRMIAVKARQKGIYTDKLTDKFIDMLENAAPMHDIGKIAVPDSILKKPGSLTDEEFDIIKTHSAEGEKIINRIFGKIHDINDEYIGMVKAVTLSHHERWDGTGYPNGISGEDIPLSARIMSIADVYDALVSKRCYKDAYPVRKAIDMISEGAGSQFDPFLAEAFSELADELEKTE